MGYYSTKTEIIKHNFIEPHEVYCSYCGKEAKYDFEISDRDQYDYYHCDCEYASLEIEKNKMEEKLTNKLKYNTEVNKELNKKKYDVELEKSIKSLMRKYNVSD